MKNVIAVFLWYEAFSDTACGPEENCSVNMYDYHGLPFLCDEMYLKETLFTSLCICGNVVLRKIERENTLYPCFSEKVILRPVAVHELRCYRASVMW